MNEENINPEEGLEEDIKRNEKKLNEEYQEQKYGNEEIRKRRESRRGTGAGDVQLDIPGIFESESGFRTTAALGTEIFLNTLVDPIPEAGTQFVAGSAINWLAQRIRGSEMSYGEMTAAGLASLIPGGAQGKAITQFAKGVGKGGLAGGIESIGMAGIDRGELPTLTEFGTSVGIGAAFGGAVSTPQAAKAIQDLRGRIVGKYKPITVYASGGFDWKHFGYKVDKRTGKLNLPTLVQRARESGNVQAEYDVSEALYTYYTELEEYIKRKGTRRGFAKFINPDTGEVYNPSFAKNSDGSVRFSLSNARLYEATRLRAKVTRGNLDERYSSSIQKQWKRFKVRDRIKMNQNEVLLASDIMDQKKAELLDIQTRLGSYQKNQLSMLQRQQLEAKRIEVSNQIQSLKAGTYYGEHGYAIDSKVWNSYALQKRYPGQKIRFQPGDAKNFHLIYEPDSLTLSARFEPGMRKLHQTFKKTKDNFDSVIEDPNIRYPDHVVHLNPNFEPDNAEKIIRIETLDSVRIGKEVQGQMSGDAVAKFDWTAMGKRVWSKAEIRAWLASYGIVPVGPKTYKPNPTLKKTRGRRMPTDPNINPKKK